MKTIKQLQAEIKRLGDEAAAAREEARKADAERLAIFSALSIEEKKAGARKFERNELNALAAEYRRKAKRLEMLRCIAHNNLAAVAEREAVKALCEVLPAYVGKQAGGKTRVKISEAIEAKTGVRIWSGERSYYGEIEGIYIYVPGFIYGKSIELYPTGEGGKRYSLIDKNNTIQPVYFSNFLFSFREYIERPQNRVNAYLKAKEAADKAKAAYNAAKSEQTRLSVEGFEL